MRFRLFALCLTTILVGATSVQAQSPKKASGPLLATYLFADLAGDNSGLAVRSGAHFYRDGSYLYAWTMMVKDEQGRYLLLPAPKDPKITEKGKVVKVVPEGSKIAITFAANNPLLIESIDIREIGSGTGLGPIAYSQNGNFADYKDNLVRFEDRSGRLVAARLDKDTTITVGRTSIKPEDIQPGQAIVLTRDKGKLLAITMLPDDTARLNTLTALGVRAAPQKSSGRFDVTLRPNSNNVAVTHELSQKMMKDLAGMPSLVALSVGSMGTRTKATISVLPEDTWTKAAAELRKFQAPFALDLNVQFNTDDTTELAKLQNLEALTLREYGSDFAATVKKMPNLKSLTMEIDADADLAKIIDHPALTGLTLGGNRERQLGVSDAGLKTLKKAPKLTNLMITPASKVTPVGYKELEGLRGLRSVTISATASKDIKKNLGITALTITDPTDEALKDVCEIKGLQELSLRNQSRITDAGLKSLKNLPKLEKLILVAPAVTNVGLRELQALKALKVLDLQIKMTDDTMAELKNLPSVRHLRLVTFLNVTEAGFAHLKEMKDLESLDLRSTRINDAGLAHLKNLKNLSWLHLPYNISTPAAPGLTGKAVDEFATAVPKCEYAVSGSFDGFSKSSKNFRITPNPFNN